uniref:Secreted protein n=1 Tax=Panagrellus redivivus TaxID=6233 RepID=A0A7E4V5D3_PANRE
MPPQCHQQDRGINVISRLVFCFLATPANLVHSHPGGAPLMIRRKELLVKKALRFRDINNDARCDFR